MKIHLTIRVAAALSIGLMAQMAGLAQSSNHCPRFPVGSAITQPKDLFSQHGVLRVNFTYRTALDQNGNTLFCFVTRGGVQSPTLHVRPGDRLLINLKNDVPAAASAMNMSAMPVMAILGAAKGPCNANTMTASSVNIHYHGTNTSPTCHQDEVIHTVINSGESFQYDVQFPLDEPPGLYWYHPHIHGISEAAVQGGASGALIVEGIQNINPEVAGLPQEVLIIRDNPVPGNPEPGGNIPSWDLSLNYVPVPSPAYTPAVIEIRPAEKRLWRVLNASADSVIDLQLQYDGTAQPLEVVALDGVPTGSQDGTSRAKRLVETDILLAPAARAEFIVTGPSMSVKNATLMTLNVDTGPDGDNDPTRPIASVHVSNDAPEPPLAIPYAFETPHRQRFAELDRAKPATERTLYFSEVLSDPNDPDSPTNFFITVDGQTPTLFGPDNPPAIVTTQGSVEDWTIENRALENHEFHIHQIHFLLLEQNGVAVNNGQYLDMIQIPYWTGSGPYPSVKVRMDFRGPLVGDFVYHCHILGHEDNGMMAIIRVKPAHGGRERR
jgi:FtsP/CotA-like multicopper oxidase with cupredoxin domain